VINDVIRIFYKERGEWERDEFLLNPLSGSGSKVEVFRISGFHFGGGGCWIFSQKTLENLRNSPKK